MTWIKSIIERLPIIWLVAFTGFGMICYFGLEIYKEHNRHQEVVYAVSVKAQVEKNSEEAIYGGKGTGINKSGHIRTAQSTY